MIRVARGRGMRSQAELANLMRMDGTISLAMLAISVTQFRARPSIARAAITDVHSLSVSCNQIARVASARRGINAIN